MPAATSKDSNPNIKVEKQADGSVRVLIEGLSIDGNMMDVEEGILHHLNRAGTAIMQEALEKHDVEGDPLFCGLGNGQARVSTQRHTRPLSEKRK